MSRTSVRPKRTEQLYRKVLVAGSGRMGTPIAHYLRELGYDAYTIDSSAPKTLDHRDLRADVTDSSVNALIRGFDMVISSLPYYLNTSLAERCFKQGTMYMDLGGRKDVTAKINKMSEEFDTYAMTDMGLAPGLVNHIGIDMVKNLKESEVNIDTVRMYCGGVAKNRWLDDPYNHIPTWSWDGLYNEYRDDCEILQDGEIVTVPALGGNKRTVLRFNGDLPINMEAFYTSGGVGHSLEQFKKMGHWLNWYSWLNQFYQCDVSHRSCSKP